MFQRLPLILLFCAFLMLVPHHAAQGLNEDTIRMALAAHAVPLQGAGEAELLTEARNHDFFLLGELHGETEIPTLLRNLWPQLWKAGYHHVGAEVSPWAAEHLEQPAGGDTASIVSLWTRDQASIVHQFAASGKDVIWGCDIEEAQPERLILDIANLNPDDASLRQMTQITAQGYSRKQASQLLSFANSDLLAHDEVLDGISLWQNLRDTLRVEALRSNSDTKLAASKARELIMKELFIARYRHEPEGKFLLRFGRNHLHRGYDARGVSTLGNFVAELALAENKSAFNVGVFAAGGKEHLVGKTFDADERQYEPAFALLASLAGNDATVFDLRPLRPLLHSIAPEKRTPLDNNLVYWADSYDFLLCYPVVTPLADDLHEAPLK